MADDRNPSGKGTVRLQAPWALSMLSPGAINRISFCTKYLSRYIPAS